jgi:transcription elongation factor GreA
MEFPMTPEGLMRLQKELNRLKNEERPAVIQEIAKARAYGDLSENAEYHAAKEKQNFLERRIRDLENKIDHAQLIDVSSLSGKKILFGATVVLRDESNNVVQYQIVGGEEADVKLGRLSVDSPLARELIGKEEGMTFDLHLPRGEKTFTIESVIYA